EPAGRSLVAPVVSNGGGLSPRGWRYAPPIRIRTRAFTSEPWITESPDRWIRKNALVPEGTTTVARANVFQLVPTHGSVNPADVRTLVWVTDVPFTRTQCR